MAIGFLSIILHAHLPFIRHPEYEDFLEEDWLFEAITETYLPVIDICESLRNDKVDFRITMTLSPPLCEMLADELLSSRYLRHLNRLIELSKKEETRIYAGQKEFYKTAVMYTNKLLRCKTLFEEHYGKNLVAAFKSFQDSGHIEIMTCTATHGYLPLIKLQGSIEAQIGVAVKNYTKHFNRAPKGIWLAECGYRPGIENVLEKYGIQFFLIDTHGLMFGKPSPKYGIYRPALCRNTNVAVFARDFDSSKQVWSAKEGYPGDYSYREFYRDIGFDAEYDYIREYLHSDGIRRNIGLKYHRITGEVPLCDKKPYDEEAALNTAASHAGNFLGKRIEQAKSLYQAYNTHPIIIAPYDAELFGHWWYEGPEFLNFLFRKIHFDQDVIKSVSLSDYLSTESGFQRLSPNMSSWGNNGYNEMWLNGTNDWIYRHLYEAEDKMAELANITAPDELTRRALNQAAREFLLAQSSDWPFIMSAGTDVPYAEKRFKCHIVNFTFLYDQIKANAVSGKMVTDLEGQNNIFPEMDYRVFRI